MNIFYNKYFYLSIFVIFLYLTPFFFLGEDSYILIHDNLDSNVIFFKTLVESGTIFSNSYSTLPMFMNAPRVSFGTEFNVILWLYEFFNPFLAYIINQVLMHSIAFIGMYVFLNRYIVKELEFKKYVILVSLLFALLPFWPSGGLSVAGLPLISYVFLNIYYKKDTKLDWFILFLFPFYSSLVLCLLFYIAVLGVIWLVDIVKRRFNLKFTLSLFVFTFLYIFLEYRLFETFLFHTDFVSHRVERVTEYYGFFQAIKSSIIHFILGQYHAHSVHIVFLPFVSIIFLINLFSKNRDKLIIVLFLINIVISLWYGFWKYEGWIYLKEHISILNTFNFSRFHFLTPLIWYILFALSIRYFIFNFKFKYKMLIVDSLIVLTIASLFYSSNFIHEYRNSGITYRQFYAENIFKKIDKRINKPKESYRVVSIGIHPSIARYNGFYTLDGYLVNYPLEYKHQFKKVILGELEKNINFKKGFDIGNRCYLFIDDVGYSYIRKKDKVYPITINIDGKTLYQMGARYIFSSYPIQNIEENNLIFIDSFEEDDSAWKIYLYQVENTIYRREK